LSDDVTLPFQSIQVRKCARSEGIIFNFEWHDLEYPPRTSGRANSSRGRCVRYSGT
jgi:hypothetical protein